MQPGKWRPSQEIYQRPSSPRRCLLKGLRGRGRIDRAEQGLSGGDASAASGLGKAAPSNFRARPCSNAPRLPTVREESAAKHTARQDALGEDRKHKARQDALGEDRDSEDDSSAGVEEQDEDEGV